MASSMVIGYSLYPSRSSFDGLTRFIKSTAKPTSSTPCLIITSTQHSTSLLFVSAGASHTLRLRSPSRKSKGQMVVCFVSLHQYHWVEILPWRAHLITIDGWILSEMTIDTGTRLFVWRCLSGKKTSFVYLYIFAVFDLDILLWG